MERVGKQFKPSKPDIIIPLNIVESLKNLKNLEQEIIKQAQASKITFDIEFLESHSLVINDMKKFCLAHNLKIPPHVKKKQELIIMIRDYFNECQEIFKEKQKDLSFLFVSNLYAQWASCNLQWNYIRVSKYIQNIPVKNFFLYDNEYVEFIKDKFEIKRETLKTEDIMCIWIIPKDVLVNVLMWNCSIQDLGRLEQTSKQMKIIIETHDVWKNVIVKRDIGIYNFPYNVTLSTKEFLKKLFTGEGFPRILITPDERYIFSSDGRKIYLQNHTTNCYRIMSLITGDYCSGGLHNNSNRRMVEFQNEYSIFRDSVGRYFLYNSLTLKEIPLEWINGKYSIVNDTIYHLNIKEAKLGLIIYDIKNNILKERELNLDHKIGYKMEHTFILQTLEGIFFKVMKESHGCTIYDVDLKVKVIQNFYSSHKKYSFGKDILLRKVKFMDKIRSLVIYDLDNVIESFYINGVVVRSNNSIQKII
jgi:hypothetical protein